MTEEHAEYKVTKEDGGTVLPVGVLLPYGDPGYSPPSTDHIREVLRRGGMTGAEAGHLVGVNGRTVRKWTGGERDIPYSAWRLLLYYADIECLEWEREPMENGRPGRIHRLIKRKLGGNDFDSEDPPERISGAPEGTLAE